MWWLWRRRRPAIEAAATEDARAKWVHAENQWLSRENRELREEVLRLRSAVGALDASGVTDGTQISRSWVVEQWREIERLRAENAAAPAVDTLRRQLSVARGRLSVAQSTLRSQANRIKNLRSIRDELPRTHGTSVGEREDARR